MENLEAWHEFFLTALCRVREMALDKASYDHSGRGNEMSYFCGESREKHSSR